MKNSCAVSVMTTDSMDFVDSLYNSLSSTYSDLRLIGLGNEDDLIILKNRYKKVISVETIGYGFSCERVVITSISAFFELVDYVVKFDEIMLWFDPYFGITGKDLSFLSSTTALQLVQLAATGICARSIEGQLYWKEHSSVVVPVVNPLFDVVSKIRNQEAIIERRDATRILIDGSSNVSNFAMVEPFITLQDSSLSTDIWCLYDGQLKPWMKPDFLISSIVLSQLPMYLNSVDGVVLVGDTHNAKDIANYIKLGKPPIVIDKSVETVVRSIMSIDLIKTEFPSFGSIQLLKELAGDAGKLSEYNALASNALFDNTYFDFKQVKNIFSRSSALKNYLYSPQMAHAKREYLEARYGSPLGSSFHQNMVLNSQVVAEYPAETLREVLLTGWALDTTTLEAARPMVLSKTGEVPSLLKRHNRKDVTEHFAVQDVEDVGYTGRFFLVDQNLTDSELLYTVDASGNSCVGMHTLLDDLNTQYTAAQVLSSGFELVASDYIQGCVETLNFESSALFTLNGIVGELSECEFRIKQGSGFIRSDSMDIHQLDKERLVRLDGTNTDDFVFSLCDCTNENGIVCLVVSGDDITPTELLCVVSSPNSDIFYSPEKSRNTTENQPELNSQSTLHVSNKDSGATDEFPCEEPEELSSRVSAVAANRTETAKVA